LPVGAGYGGCKLPSLSLGVLELCLQCFTRSIHRADNHDSVLNIAHACAFPDRATIKQIAFFLARPNTFRFASSGYHFPVFGITFEAYGTTKENLMSDQESTIRDLIKTLEDGRDGFAKAAERLQGDAAPDVSRKFREFSARRGAMADELRRGANLSNKAPEGGTVGGAIHRGWIAVKDALTGDDPSAVIAAAEQGEDHAKAKFHDALEDQTLSADVRAIVQRQAAEVEAAHDYVSSLKHAHR